jgi:hypothetical protein
VLNPSRSSAQAGYPHWSLLAPSSQPGYRHWSLLAPSSQPGLPHWLACRLLLGLGQLLLLIRGELGQHLFGLVKLLVRGCGEGLELLLLLAKGC